MKDLTLGMLNRCTQAWVEMEYHRTVHGETGQPPIERFLAGPDLTRPSPTPEELVRRFSASAVRTQRHSDGTLSVQSVRFEAAGFGGFIHALQAIVAGRRDRTLADAADLDDTMAAEILFLIETLQEPR